MRLEEHIRLSILNYPTIFKNRSDVLNHLFCVIGNGYEWKDGELVSWDMDRQATTKKDAKKALTDWLLSADERIGLSRINERDYQEHKKPKESRKTFARRWLKEVRYVDAYAAIDDIDQRVTQVMDKSFYPISEYSRMCTVPNDVKEDWLDGAIECCRLVLASGVRDKFNGNNKKKARKILKELLARKEK